MGFFRLDGSYATLVSYRLLLPLVRGETAVAAGMRLNK
jgi:hypothetical protein